MPPQIPTANDQEPTVLLTVPEVADLLRLRPKSVYALLARDPASIPGARKIGGSWRVHRATVLGWIAGQDSVARPKGARR